MKKNFIIGQISDTHFVNKNEKLFDIEYITGGQETIEYNTMVNIFNDHDDDGQ